jgi:hypothetical protein
VELPSPAASRIYLSLYEVSLAFSFSIKRKDCITDVHENELNNPTHCGGNDSCSSQVEVLIECKSKVQLS